MSHRRVIYLNGEHDDPLVEHIVFPTGEKHLRIKKLLPGPVTLVYTDPSGDLMKLGMAVDICRRAGVPSIALIMPFVPYARQDESYVDGDPISICVFAAFINSLSLDHVLIVDPHSKVTPALINNCQIVPQHEIAACAVMDIDNHLRYPVALIAPDLGAAKKVKLLQSHIKHLHGLDFPVIQCDKIRDPHKGHIKEFRILSGDPQGHHCLIVDDICDGGGTFAGLATILRESDVCGMSLYITHGIFSKGTDMLLRYFDKLYTSDSLPRSDGTTIIDLEPFCGLSIRKEGKHEPVVAD